MGVGHQALLMVQNGAMGDVTLASSYNVYAYMVFPNQARARFQVHQNGFLWRRSNNTAAVNAGTWLNVGVASDYEVMFHPTTGSLTAGAEDTWELASTSPTYEVNSTSGTVECIGILSIRDVATNTVQATATLYLMVDSS